MEKKLGKLKTPRVSRGMFNSPRKVGKDRFVGKL